MQNSINFFLIPPLLAEAIFIIHLLQSCLVLEITPWLLMEKLLSPPEME